MKARCKAIHNECVLFAGCHAHVFLSKPTGVSPSDILPVTTGVFNGVAMSSPSDACGKTFQVYESMGGYQKA